MKSKNFILSLCTTAILSLSIFSFSLIDINAIEPEPIKPTGAIVYTIDPEPTRP